MGMSIMMLMLVFIIMFAVLNQLHAGANRRALMPWT